MSHDPSVHSLHGLVAIVTGASRGIGRAIALAYARAGAAVVINHAPDQDCPQDLLDLISAGGGRAVAVQADVGSPAEHARLVEAALARFGRIDILVNNAAIKGKGPFLDVTESTWEEVMSVNLKGPYFLAQRVALQMVGAGIHGRIINVTSNHETKPLNNSSVYSISKCGLHMLTLSLARELAAHHITVNSLIPGSYVTPMNLDAMTDPARREAAGKWIPLGRMGEPEDMAAAAIFLASPQSDYITGSSLRVDGGIGLM
jgi:NAD(P)-dependent dehydrogenase (short-subunit alcohol dehydrogenase family)